MNIEKYYQKRLKNSTFDFNKGMILACELRFTNKTINLFSVNCINL